MEKNNQHLRNGVLAITGAVILLGIVILPNLKKEAVPPQLEREETHVSPFFKNVTIEAEAAYVWDARTDTVLYEKNSEAQLPLASLTKVMTALVANELLPEESAVAITTESLAIEGDTGLVAGERWSIEELIELSLVASSNDAAYAIAAAAGAFGAGEVSPVERFVAHMNEKAEELNLAQTYFLNPTGLDTNPAVSGGYGSARDVASLFMHFLSHHPDDAYTSSRSATQFGPDPRGERLAHAAANTNPLTARIPGLIASKTGFTDLAGGNLAVVVDYGLNRPIVLVVLGSGFEERFNDIEVLSDAAFKTVALEKAL